MNRIPEDFRTFLHWVKERTETNWSRDFDYHSSYEWIRGAKWIGLKETEIDAVEQKYQIKFTPDHRAFLNILHTIDRKEVVEDMNLYATDTDVSDSERPFFYNWLTDEQYIKKKMNQPFEDILWEVVQRKLWLKTWGEKPASEEASILAFKEIYQKSPKLIPIYSHRFVVSEPLCTGNPVLSICGSDTIIYGQDLRAYLILELQIELMQSSEMEYDEEDEEWYWKITELRELFEKGKIIAENRTIPFWNDFL